MRIKPKRKWEVPADAGGALESRSDTGRWGSGATAAQRDGAAIRPQNNYTPQRSWRLKTEEF